MGHIGEKLRLILTRSLNFVGSFLEERLRTVKQRLEASEKELVAYGAAEQIINVDATTQDQRS